MRLASIIAASLAWALSAAAALAQPADFSARKEGMRVFSVGNSHSASTIGNGFEYVMKHGGHPDHTQYGVGVAGGSLHHNLGAKGEEARRELAKGYDVLILQSYNRAKPDEIEAAITFTQYARAGNPKVRVIMYSIWPDVRDDWSAPNPDRSEEWTRKVMAGLKERFPDLPVHVAPTGIVMRELAEMANSGNLPNVPNWRGLFLDSGHVGQYGGHAVVSVLGSMVYLEPPFDYPAVHGKQGKLKIEPETAEIIHRVAWDVLTTWAPAKMGDRLVVATRKLQPAIAGQPYRHQLDTLHADGKVRWRIGEGSLPAGLTLDENGVISGTADSPGSAGFVVEATDGANVARREFGLRVAQDTPPEIVTEELPATPLDRFALIDLSATGGVGQLKWSLADGELPIGVNLYDAGKLVGNPGLAGEYRFTLQVTDRHPAGAKSDRKTYVWKVTEASTTTAHVHKIPRGSAELRRDGKLEEEFWAHLPSYPITKAVKGEPRKVGRFKIAWIEGRSVKNHSLVIGLEVEDGPDGKTPLDAVELYWDPKNDKEVIYNYDDNHHTITRAGRRSVTAGYLPHYNSKAYAVETADGFTMELTLRSGAFMGLGASGYFGPGRVAGLELGITEGTEGQESRTVWRGTAANDTDTSGWGVIVLTETPWKDLPASSEDE